jgi:membrane protein
MLDLSPLRRAWRNFFADRCPMMAAAIAYQVLFAIVPVTALLVAAAGFALSAPDVRNQVVQYVVERIPLDRNLVIDAIRSVAQSGTPLTFAGTLLLLWTAVGMLSTVRDSLNSAWGVRGGGIVHQKLIDVASVIGLTLLLLFSVAGTTALHGMASPSTTMLGRASTDFDRVWDLFAGSVPAFATFAAFLLAYRFLPNVRQGFRDVLPGTLLGTVLFEAGKHGFTLYVARFNRYEMLYGSLGAVLLFQLWIYVSALILLAGAELNAAARRPE